MRVRNFTIIKGYILLCTSTSLLTPFSEQTEFQNDESHSGTKETLATTPPSIKQSKNKKKQQIRRAT